MSLLQESYVQSLLADCDHLQERQEREAREAVVKKIDLIHELLRRNIRDAFLAYSLDSIVRFTEIAVEVTPLLSRYPRGSPRLPKSSASSSRGCRPPTSSTSVPSS